MSDRQHPSDSLKFAEQVARYGGVFFVVAGAFFTVHSMGILEAERDFAASSFRVDHVAQVISPNVEPGTEPEPVEELVDDIEPFIPTPADEENDEEKKNAPEEEERNIQTKKHEGTTKQSAESSGTSEPQSSTDEEIDIEPEPSINLSRGDVLSEKVRIKASVQGARQVEFFVRKDQSLIREYLGSARAIDGRTWGFEWDTTQVPNGSYTLFAVIENKYGTYDSERIPVVVKNEIVVIHTDEEKERIEEIEEVKRDIKEVEEEIGPIDYQIPVKDIVTDTTDDALPSVEKKPVPAIEESDDERDAPIATSTPRHTKPVLVTKEIVSNTEDEVERLREEIKTDLERLSVSIRTGDEAQAEEIRTRLKERRETAVESIFEDAAGDPEDLAEAREQVRQKLDTIVVGFEEETIRREKIIRDRVGDDVFRDSDKDGVSDYDEINLYQTDPFAADTDGDGFIDGTEILNGFDPRSESTESAIAYESPKEQGPEREDILTVTSIAPAPEPAPERGAPAAVISGKGLPNSFVTLYVFSTPIIVTVKTDDDGSWVYRFDKELEDGTHEVYVGITDNAGKIIAKSRPLTFVKEAEAFTAAEAATFGPTTRISNEPPAFLPVGATYLILSLSVIAIGLVLMMLGMYTRRERHMVLGT